MLFREIGRRGNNSLYYEKGDFKRLFGNSAYIKHLELSAKAGLAPQCGGSEPEYKPAQALTNFRVVGEFLSPVSVGASALVLHGLESRTQRPFAGLTNDQALTEVRVF